MTKKMDNYDKDQNRKFNARRIDSVRRELDKDKDQDMIKIGFMTSIILSDMKNSDLQPLVERYGFTWETIEEKMAEDKLDRIKHLEDILEIREKKSAKCYNDLVNKTNGYIISNADKIVEDAYSKSIDSVKIAQQNLDAAYA